MKKLLLLLLPALVLSCSGGSDDNSGSGASVAYFRAKLDGIDIDFTQDNTQSPDYAQSYYWGGCFLTGLDCVIDYGADLRPLLGFYPSFGLTFDNLYNEPGQEGENTAFSTLFQSPPLNFITYDQEAGDMAGIHVDYTKADETAYSTLMGSQAGSTVNITSSVAGMSDGLKIQTITGTVTCKLYNYDDPTDVIVLTNGKFKLIFSEKGNN